jgi:hypothetical protein
MKEEGEDVTGASFGIGAVPNWYVLYLRMKILSIVKILNAGKAYTHTHTHTSTISVFIYNSFHPQINLEVLTTKMDWAKLHRSRDPGAGAFTPYHNRRSYAYRNIRAGYVTGRYELA